MRARRLAAVLLVALAVTAVAGALWYVAHPQVASPVPPWSGRGTWESCAAIAPVKPAQAVLTAVAHHNFTPEERAGLQARVTPRYLNETADLFDVTCDGAASIGAPQGGLGMRTDGRPHFSWEVLLMPNGFTLCVYYDFVDWSTGKVVGSFVAC